MDMKLTERVYSFLQKPVAYRDTTHLQVGRASHLPQTSYDVSGMHHPRNTSPSTDWCEHNFLSQQHNLSCTDQKSRFPSYAELFQHFYVEIG